MTTFANLLQARFPQVSEEFILELEKEVADELGMGLDYDAIEARQKEEREAMTEAAKQALTQPGVSNVSEATKGKEAVGITPASKTKKGDEKDKDL
jgi:hypothetical protein